MPLYEYQCEQCGHRFELIRKFSDPPVETCPKCGGAVRKLLSSPAIQFKGSGWYITDYARKDSSATPPSETDVSAKKETTETAEKKTEKSDKTEKSEKSGKSGKSETTASPKAPADPVK